MGVNIEVIGTTWLYRWVLMSQCNVYTNEITTQSKYIFYTLLQGCSLRVRLLPIGVSMPPTKVCPQCKDAVPVKRKTCERCDLVFRFKQKAECNLVISWCFTYTSYS